MTVTLCLPVSLSENPSNSPNISLSPDDHNLIRKALTILERHFRQPGIQLTSSSATCDWLRLKMSGLEREVFMVLFLDQQNRLLAYETLFAGTIAKTEVHPREVVKAALRHNAAAVIFAHNHPSGYSEPSQADRQLTTRLQNTLSLVDIRTLDHFIIGHTEVVSFAERGWL